jgi:quercetin dioxygenase-like cupin family protein
MAAGPNFEMRLNDDFAQPASAHAAAIAWVPSPTPGVERRMLFRIGEEKARATSIVRYAPKSRFPAHGHPGGEEILVLEGVFQDESGDYPAGSYLRNPPGSSHTPGSAQGCVIFVKLWQFRRDDAATIRRKPAEGEIATPTPDVDRSRILFDDGHEEVRLEDWRADETIKITNPDGLELLLLQGGFSHGQENFDPLSWLRLPAGMDLSATTGPDGARIWWKKAALLPKEVCAF